VHWYGPAESECSATRTSDFFKERTPFPPTLKSVPTRSPCVSMDDVGYLTRTYTLPFCNSLESFFLLNLFTSTEAGLTSSRARSRCARVNIILSAS